MLSVFTTRFGLKCSKTWFLFLVNVLLSSAVVCLETQSAFRNYRYTELLDLADKDITSNVIVERTVGGKLQCSEQCSTDENCVSFQFYRSPGKTPTCKIFSRRKLAGESTLQGARHYLKHQDNCPESRGYRFNASADLCFKLFIKPKSYGACRDQCTTQGARLLILENETQWKMIRDVLTKEWPDKLSFWINGKNSDGIFKTTENFPNPYFKWKVGQPDGDYTVNSHCIGLRRPSREMQDIPCGFGYNCICEIVLI